MKLVLASSIECFRNDGPIFSDFENLLGDDEIRAFALSGYYNSPRSVFHTSLKAKSSNVIIIPGGNTFRIMYNYKTWGIDKMIRQWAEEGKVLIGTSAGAITLTKNILTAQYADRLGTLKNCFENFDGIGLVDFLVKPHFGFYIPKYLNEFHHFADYMNTPMYGIHEDGAIIVNDGRIITHHVDVMLPYSSWNYNNDLPGTMPTRDELDKKITVS